jgi:hypothetical protein
MVEISCKLAIMLEFLFADPMTKERRVQHGQGLNSRRETICAKHGGVRSLQNSIIYYQLVSLIVTESSTSFFF